MPPDEFLPLRGTTFFEELTNSSVHAVTYPIQFDPPPYETQPSVNVWVRVENTLGRNSTDAPKASPTESLTDILEGLAFCEAGLKLRAELRRKHFPNISQFWLETAMAYFKAELKKRCGEGPTMWDFLEDKNA